MIKNGILIILLFTSLVAAGKTVALNTTPGNAPALTGPNSIAKRLSALSNDHTLQADHTSQAITSQAINDTRLQFPTDAAILDVTEFGAIPSDGLDDTAAIQQALDTEASSNRIIYLPDGIYNVSNRLDWPGGDSESVAHKRTILQGQSQEQTIIKNCRIMPATTSL